MEFIQENQLCRRVFSLQNRSINPHNYPLFFPTSIRYQTSDIRHYTPDIIQQITYITH